MSFKIVAEDVKKLKVDAIVDVASLLACNDEDELREFFRLNCNVNSITIPLFTNDTFTKEEVLGIAIDEIDHNLNVYFVYESLNNYDDLDAYLDSYLDDNQMINDSGLDYALEERVEHLSDTFSEYLLYLIKQKGLSNAEVYKRAVITKKTFSKIKNDSTYHPNKMTAMRLCVGAKLDIKETKDLLARAGYALSPCDKTDVIFSYFIEMGKYDMIELDIQLEKHGEHCIIF